VTAIDSALPRIRVEEGFRSRPYLDTEKHLTVGYGLNLDAGISERVAAAALLEQLQELHEMLSRYSWYAGLDPVRQGVCLDIAFNDGLHGLVNGFPKMISALAKGDWTVAQSECHVTNPELQERYNVLAKILLTGVA
jgi:lysozyme